MYNLRFGVFANFICLHNYWNKLNTCNSHIGINHSINLMFDYSMIAAICLTSFGYTHKHKSMFPI